MSDRIKLAEAMGWKHLDASENPPHLVGPMMKGPKGNIEWLECIPDPFSDANDDYAVLEWMRLQKRILEFWVHVPLSAWKYKIGDYARAALKVLE